MIVSCLAAASLLLLVVPATAADSTERPVLPPDAAEHVAELEARIEELKTTGTDESLAEALTRAGEILTIRLKHQGPTAGWTSVDGEPAEWYEVGDAKREVEDLGFRIELDPQSRAELATADANGIQVRELYGQGRYDEAVELTRSQLTHYRKVYGDEHLAVARSLINLAGLLQKEGDYEAAEQLSRESLAMRRTVLGDEHPKVAGGLNSLGGMLYYRGEFSAAEQLFREALALHRRLLDDEHPKVVENLSNLAVLLFSKGDYAAAEPLYRESLALHRKLLGDEHPNVAFSLNALAMCLKAEGDYAAAETLYREALVLNRKLLGDEHPQVAHNLTSLASLLHSQGDYAAAESLFREALAIYRRLHGNEHPEVAYTLSHLASLLEAQREYAEAEPLYREALAINRKLLGDEHPQLASNLSNLALLLDKQGDLTAAEPLYREALAMRRKLLGDEHPEVALVLNNLAGLLKATGDYAAAEQLYREALAIRVKTLDPEHPHVVKSLNNMAALQYDQGDFSGAEKTWTAAAERFEAARLRVDFGGLERVQFTARHSPLKSLAVCRARNGKMYAAWKALESDLARGLLDTVAAREARPLDKGEQDLEQSLIDQLSTLDEQISSMQESPAGPDETRKRIEDLRKKREERLAEFVRFEAEMVAKYGVAAGEVYELPRIQAQLTSETALLAWVDTKGNRQAVNSGGEHWACLVLHQGDPLWIKLSGGTAGGTWSNADNELSDSLRTALQHQSPDASAQQAQSLIQRLRAQRLAPVEPYLTGIRHLIVLPAGTMAGIPLEVLTDDYTVSYTPSGTMYAWLREDKHKTQQQPAAVVRPESLLALGDPAFPTPEEPDDVPVPPDHGVLLATVAPGSNAWLSGLIAGDVLLSYGEKKLEEPTQLGPTIQLAQSLPQTSGTEKIPVSLWRNGETLELSVDPGKLGVRSSKLPAPEAILARRRLDGAVANTRGQYFTPVPATRHEVESIARLFSRPEDEARPTILLGAEASEQRLDALSQSGKLKKYRYLHLATHGVMDDRRAMDSAMILSRGSWSDTFEQAVAGQEIFDGRLTAGRIVRTWKLDADLVALSGCETALGRMSGGEGYLGFSQALFVAGARSLLLSLWKVDDRATMLLMTRFYENILGIHDQPRPIPGGSEYPAGAPLPKAEALREAKIWLRTLTVDQLRILEANRGKRSGTGIPPAAAATAGSNPFRPYQDPQYWASFILIGNPD